MPTGDNHDTAQAVAKELYLADFKASMLPENKLQEVEKLHKEEKVVAMVDDVLMMHPRWQKVTWVLQWIHVPMSPLKVP